MASAEPADVVLKKFQVPGQPLYLVGTFERGVTVYSQQIRALNLIWALVEGDILECQLLKDPPVGAKRNSIAIIGGGFAGLIAGAALLKKGVHAEITLFEQRDTLLPLQHGCDTRWLHPRIYNWPAEGSEHAVASLPILNWTAGRASDVAAEILLKWRDVAEPRQADLAVYCNATHLQVHERNDGLPGLKIEWVGERRNYDGSVHELNTSVGETKAFDHVIIAIGFGLERRSSVSYWRNDSFGQPSLAEPHRTYLVSGQGDSAMIDVLRLRISQYRQDRILEELFVKIPGLHPAVKEIQASFPQAGPGMFEAFEKLEKQPHFSDVREELTTRLRRDTSVILHLKKRTFADLFQISTIKISFQNRLLIYLLYKCGGFVPSSEKVKVLAKTHAIPREQIIIRHGTKRDKNLKRLLSDNLHNGVAATFGNGASSMQPDSVNFPGGYFGFPGSLADASNLGDEIRQEWRKEYLPGPSALIALSLSAAIAGVLQRRHPPDHRLRVTLHRTITVGDEELLQQCCDYVGLNITQGKSPAGRTFPAINATIGLAYKCRANVRSAKNVSPEELKKAMASLDLNTASRDMSAKVGFVLAMPILQPENAGIFHGPNPVAGVVYVDSEAPNYFIDDNEITDIAVIVQSFVNVSADPGRTKADRIRNIPLVTGRDVVPPKQGVPNQVAGILEVVSSVPPPRTTRGFQLNFDYADFVPVWDS